LKVNFLIVGAQKAGTTALASFLAQHPDVCVSRRKELHVFDAPDYRDTRGFWDERYAVGFPDYRGQPWIGEATPTYMYFPFVAERIYRYNPDMRLIALLRNPAERAISHYKMEISRDTERLPLIAALAAERFRLSRAQGALGWNDAPRAHSYLDRGFYSRQIQRLLHYFSRDQFLILRSDDLLAHHVETLETVYEFLGVNRPERVPLPEIIRPPLDPRALEVKRPEPVPLAETVGPPLETEAVEKAVDVSRFTRAALRRVYRNEINRLEQMLGWNLDNWR
jgi:hypothetical protein